MPRRRKNEPSSVRHLRERRFEEVRPTADGTWIEQAHGDFSSLMPLGTKETKSARLPAQERAIFELYSLGVVTARDDWVYDSDSDDLRKKVKSLISAYDADQKRLSSAIAEGKVLDAELDYSIKWTRAVKASLKQNRKIRFAEGRIVDAIYRPFTKINLYFDRSLNEMPYQQWSLFPPGAANRALVVDVSGKPFSGLAVGTLPDYHVNGDGVAFPISRYVGTDRIDNITDWALTQFQAHYPDTDATKDDIFAYVYAVLHDPVYRETYALNLRREFPRIPFYPDFARWRDWGRTLLDLHIGYEGVAPFDLTRVETPLKRGRAMKAGEAKDLLDVSEPVAPKPILKSKPDEGSIVLDAATTLTGVPAQAWTYRLGNPLGHRLGAGPAQGEDAQGPHHPRQVQHLPLRRPRRARDRASAARHHGQRSHRRDHRVDEDGQSLSVGPARAGDSIHAITLAFPSDLSALRFPST